MEKAGINQVEVNDLCFVGGKGKVESQFQFEI